MTFLYIYIYIYFPFLVLSNCKNLSSRKFQNFSITDPQHILFKTQNVLNTTVTCNLLSQRPIHTFEPKKPRHITSHHVWKENWRWEERSKRRGAGRGGSPSPTPHPPYCLVGGKERMKVLFYQNTPSLNGSKWGQNWHFTHHY